MIKRMIVTLLWICTLNQGLVAQVEQQIIKGTVYDPNGCVVTDVKVSVEPAFRKIAQATKTDSQGRFELRCRPRQPHHHEDQISRIVVRQKARNLVGLVKLKDDLKEVKVQLQRGLIVSGCVKDVQGHGLAHAKVGIQPIYGRTGFFLERDVRVDPNGHYEFNAVPQGIPFWISASAEGYGEYSVKCHPGEAIEDRLECAPMVLALANRSLRGQVVDVDHRPVAGIGMYCAGDGQPERRVQTDQQGRFEIQDICAGEIGITVQGGGEHHYREWISTNTEAENLVIVVQERDADGRVIPKKRMPLKGKPFPFKPFETLEQSQIQDQSLLVCFFDYEQRLDRRRMSQVAGKLEPLAALGITVVAVDLSGTQMETLQSWAEGLALSSVIQLKDGKEKARLNWSIQSLPWMILTDKEHKVVGEGLNVEEVIEKRSGATSQ